MPQRAKGAATEEADGVRRGGPPAFRRRQKRRCYLGRFLLEAVLFVLINMLTQSNTLYLIGEMIG